MARAAALVKTSMWDVGSDFRTLTPDAQRVYLLLLSQPQLNYCGVITYVPERWARMAAGDTITAVESAIAELEAGEYVLVDRDTGELMIRTFLKHDQVAEKPNVLKAAKREFQTIESDRLRARLIHDWPHVFGTDETPPDAPAGEQPGTHDGTLPGRDTGTVPRAGAGARADAHDRTTYTDTDTYTDTSGGDEPEAAAAQPAHADAPHADAADSEITKIDAQLEAWQVGRPLRLDARQDIERAKACIARVLAERNLRSTPGAFYRSLWEAGVTPDIAGPGRRKRRPLADVAASTVDNLGPHLRWPDLREEIAKLERERREQLTVDQLADLERRHQAQRHGGDGAIGAAA